MSRQLHPTQSEAASTLFLNGSALLVLYLSYRYPLQINFSGTSQTYSDTPFALQVGKFIVAIGLCVYALVRFRLRRVNADGLMFCGVLGALAVASLAKSVYGEKAFVEFSFWAVVPLLLCLTSGPLAPARLDTAIRRLFILSAIVECVQIILFFVYGRLPALAWEGSISIRFGSFLDDPNGFAALCFLFLGWAWFHPQPMPRFLYTSLALLLLLISQSLTAIVFLVPVLAILGARSLWRRPVWLLLVIPLLVMVLMFGGGVALVEGVRAVYEYKQPSIDMHVGFRLSDMVSGGASQFLFGSSDYVFYEAWWAQSVHNWGAPWTLLLLLVTLYALARAFANFRRARGTAYQGIWFGIFLFMLYVVLGGFNLPFFIVFPVNYVFFAMLALLMLDKVAVPVRPHGASEMVV